LDISALKNFLAPLSVTPQLRAGIGAAASQPIVASIGRALITRPLCRRTRTLATSGSIFANMRQVVHPPLEEGSVFVRQDRIQDAKPHRFLDTRPDEHAVLLLANS
jgi:hypothetical protein